MKSQPSWRSFEKLMAARIRFFRDLILEVILEAVDGKAEKNNVTMKSVFCQLSTVSTFLLKY